MMLTIQIILAAIAVASMLLTIGLTRKIRRELDELKALQVDLLQIENRLRAFSHLDTRVGDSNRNFREGKL